MVQFLGRWRHISQSQFQGLEFAEVYLEYVPRCKSKSVDQAWRNVLCNSKYQLVLLDEIAFTMAQISGANEWRPRAHDSCGLTGRLPLPDRYAISRQAEMSQARSMRFHRRDRFLEPQYFPFTAVVGVLGMRFYQL